ncbi:hypothetical protein V8E54_000518 [Elaphomyces granulatus]
MDELTGKVATIESDLYNHRRRLQTLETDAQKSIGGEIQGLRTALTNGDGKVQDISLETQTCLFQIEDHVGDNSLIDLKPQMTLLSTGLGEVVGELETARSRAETALNHVIDYTYKVMDVGQEVESSRSKLNKAEADSKILVDEAQKELNMSERRLAATLSKITDKENEIRTKTDEANGKRLQKNQLDAEILNKNQKIHDTERGVKRRKGTAAVSTGVGIFGALLAPVTFGASLVVTAAAATVTAQNEISQAEREVSALEQRKRELQLSVKRCRDEVVSWRLKQQEYHNQIQKTGRIQGEISILDDYASATISNIRESQRELQQIKQNLDDCSALVKKRSLEVQTDSGFIERFLGKKHQRKREFERQKTLLQDVSNTLNKIRSEIPALLPGTV